MFFPRATDYSPDLNLPEIKPPHIEPPKINPPKIEPPKIKLPHFETGPVKPNYKYDASEAAAMLFCVVFGICLLAHLIQATRYRTLWVWPLILGLILEVLGFTMRWYSIEELFVSWPVIIHDVTVIIAPAFITAQNYMMVGRMITYLGKEYSPVSQTLITVIFVLADVASIITQGVSGLMLNGTDLNTTRTAFKVLIVGLVFQVVMFLIFVCITVVFDRRTRRALGAKRRPIQPLFVAFYISAGMIILRSIYRASEFSSLKLTATGATGYALDHEWLLYVWDALPMTVAVVTLAVVHAGRFLPQENGLRIDGTREPSKPRRGCCCRRKARAVKSEKSGLPPYSTVSEYKMLPDLPATGP
ncbi:RTA1-domain-containing protein [Auricularia subglabra TFB-10046 SS5]|nr:RTA1-domain-containing protein [Auricularia subglabra TFB-10046 SS5]